MGVNKLEKFEITVVHRRDIHGADYNPRTISEGARKKLKAKIKKHGNVQPIIVNKRTMNIVGGHQRLNEFDTLLKIDDYRLTVSMIDVSEREEVEINIILNNTELQGEWDTFKLQDLHNIFPDINFEEDLGFDESTLDIMLGDIFKDTEPETPIIDPMKEAKKELNAEDYRQMKKDQRDKKKNDLNDNPADVHELSDLDYTLTIVFPNNRDKADFMKKIKKDPKEKFVKSNILFDISKGVYNLSSVE